MPGEGGTRAITRPPSRTPRFPHAETSSATTSAEKDRAPARVISRFMSHVREARHARSGRLRSSGDPPAVLVEALQGLLHLRRREQLGPRPSVEYRTGEAGEHAHLTLVRLRRK